METSSRRIATVLRHLNASVSTLTTGGVSAKESNNYTVIDRVRLKQLLKREDELFRKTHPIRYACFDM